jgi:hypothetical protein
LKEIDRISTPRASHAHSLNRERDPFILGVAEEPVSVQRRIVRNKQIRICRATPAIGTPATRTPATGIVATGTGATCEVTAPVSIATGADAGITTCIDVSSVAPVVRAAGAADHGSGHETHGR